MLVDNYRAFQPQKMDDESLDRILEEMFPGEPPFESQQPHFEPPPQPLLEEVYGVEPPSKPKRTNSHATICITRRQERAQAQRRPIYAAAAAAARIEAAAIR